MALTCRLEEPSTASTADIGKNRSAESTADIGKKQVSRVARLPRIIRPNFGPAGWPVLHRMCPRGGDPRIGPHAYRLIARTLPPPCDHRHEMSPGVGELAQLRPRQPPLPALRQLLLRGVERWRVAVSAHVRRLVQDAEDRPEPAHVIGGAALLVDAAHRPLTAVDGVVLAVLVDRGRAGRAH